MLNETHTGPFQGSDNELMSMLGEGSMSGTTEVDGDEMNYHTSSIEWNDQHDGGTYTVYYQSPYISYDKFSETYQFAYDASTNTASETMISSD